MKTQMIKLENDELIEDGANSDSPSYSQEPESYQRILGQTGIQICTDDYPGQFNFDIFLDVTPFSKRHWMYSEVLNKVYIDMDQVLPIQFQWKIDDIELLELENLQIRALPIFANSEFQQLSIKRCPLHIMQDELHDQEKIKHLIWSEQKNAVYEKNPNSQRRSVVTIVHDSSPCSDFKTYNVIYKFKCKSSCKMSLSRRPIFVIFTLETLQGKVLGRKKLGVKVCSSPRRDMLNEEDLENKILTGLKPNNKRTSLVVSCEIPGKILKVNNNNNEDGIYELPVLPIVGKQQYLNTLELLHGHFVGSAIRGDHLIDSHPLISMLADLISKVKSESSQQFDKADSEKL